ncbi:MAG TPA: aldo/keto reductase [Polyangia bacterium]|nr:aldo/keto reductase [Polyangia bacterium]
MGRRDRRQFLAHGVGNAAARAGGAAAGAGPPKKPLPGAPREADVELPAGARVPRRPLGKTGVEVSALGLGGFHIGLPKDDATAIDLVRQAVDWGVTFMDNCWDYNDGKSHDRMGRALAGGYRQKVFLMTKIDGRTKQAAAAQIDQSLRALRTDVIDLVQIHEVIRMNDAERCFGPDGAIEALVAARAAGKLRFIGFTGHKSPQIHLHMLETARAHGFHFDTVQMPLNVMDAHYDSFEARVLPVLVERGIGVLGMKPLGSGLFFKSAPLARGDVTATDCLQYALGLPTSVVITGCDTRGILKQAVHAAVTLGAVPHGHREEVLRRTDPAAKRGEWEQYKTTGGFDGTAQNPWWLETGSLQKPG